jgi:cell division protein FtsL
MINAYRLSFFKRYFSFRSIILILIFLLLLSVIFLVFVQKYQEKAMASSSMEQEELEEQNNKLETFQKEFCGLNAKPNSNQYIIEYVLPQACEMPLGVAVDNAENKIASFCISSMVGALSLAALLPTGKPRAIFFQLRVNHSFHKIIWLLYNNLKLYIQLFLCA